MRSVSKKTRVTLVFFLLLSLLYSVHAAGGPTDSATIQLHEVRQVCRAQLEQASRWLREDSRATSPPEIGLEDTFSIDVEGYRRQLIWQYRLGVGYAGLAALTRWRIERQAEEAIKFLKDQWRQLPFPEPALLSFNRIEIRPMSYVSGPRRAVDLIGDTLVIRVWNGLILSDDKLRSIVDKGHHYPMFSSDRRLWKFRNPNGSIRRDVRLALHLLSKEMGSFVNVLRAGHQPGAVGVLREKVIQGFCEKLQVEELESPLLALIQDASEDKLLALLNAIEGFFGEENGANRFEATTRVAEVPLEESGIVDVNIDNTWLIYGNLKVITVSAGYGSQSHTVAMAGGVGPRKITVNMYRSIIGGYLIDIVSVQATVEKLYIAEGIGQAVKKVLAE